MKESKNQASTLSRRDVLKGTVAGGLGFSAFARLSMSSAVAEETADSIFDTKDILDESTLDRKILQDWHVDEVTGSTRQKLIEINVAQWWPGQDYRIPVRMIVPLKGKANGFHITGANPYEGLMKDSRPTALQAKLLAGGVGIVKTHVKAFRQIPGKRG